MIKQLIVDSRFKHRPNVCEAFPYQRSAPPAGIGRNLVEGKLYVAPHDLGGGTGTEPRQNLALNMPFTVPFHFFDQRPPLVLMIPIRELLKRCTARGRPHPG